MKIFFGEFPANYEKYHFPYQVWLVKEEGDDVSQIYEKGFMPIRSLKDVYYLSRSVRVNLSKFQLSSENRRILRKTEEFKFRLVKLDKFDYTPLVQKTCKNWFEQKFGERKITAAAIRKIFTSSIFTDVFVWRVKENVVGYAVVYINKDLLHYAHVFTDPQFSKSNLSVRMMLEAIIWAKKSKKKYAYLGTCYTKSALYKTQYAGMEFFNGFSWSDNLEELKYLIERENENYLFQDKEYLARFTSGKGIKGTEGIKGII